ncbi:PAS domain S-box protein [Desulfobaculum senezii]
MKMEHEQTRAEMQEELRTLRAKVRELESRLHVCQAPESAILESVVDGLDTPVFVKDGEHRWVYMNRAGASILGDDPEGFLGQTDHDRLDQLEADRHWAEDDLVWQAGAPMYFRGSRTWDGSSRQTRSKKIPYVHPETGKRYIIGIIEDMTEMDASRKAAEESELRYRLLVDNAREAITVIDTDRIIYANRRAQEMAGYSLDELRGMALPELVYPADREKVFACQRERLAGRPAPETYDFRMVTRTREALWLSVTPMCIDWEGKPAVLSFYTDISETVAAREAFECSERRLRKIIDLVPHMIFARDYKGRYLMANKATAEACGTTVERLVGASYTEFCSKKSGGRDMFVAYDRKVLVTGEARYAQEVPFTDVNGTERILQCSFIPFDFDKGRRACLAVCTDVTRELRTKQRLSMLSSALLSFGSDHRENINLVVELCGALLGAECAVYNRLHGERLCVRGGWNAPSTMPPEDVAKGHICTDIIGTGRIDELQVLRNLADSPYAETDPNVRRYDIETYLGMPVFLQGQAVGALCAVYCTDYEPTYEDEWLTGVLASAISVEEDRLRSTMQLRESEARYRAAFDQGAVGMVHLDISGAYLKVNDRYCEITGYSRDELTGVRFDQITHPLDRERNRDLHEKIICGALDYYDVEKRYLRRDGSVCWVRVTASPVRSASGQMVLINALILDVSARKQAEQALRENEEKYRMLFHNASDAIFLRTGEVGEKPSRFVDCNEKACTMFRMPREALLARGPQEILGPLDTAGALDHPVETRATANDGRVLDLEVGSHAFLLGGERVVLSVVRDISGRKEMEKAVLRRDAVLEAVGFAAERFLHSPDWRGHMSDVLGRIGTAADVSRVYVFRNFEVPDKGLAMGLEFEWCGEDVEPQIDTPHLQCLLYDEEGLHLVRETLERREVYRGNVADLPSAHRAVLQPQGIVSIAIVPIFAGDALWGFVGFDECRTQREWYASELEALMAAADILGNAIVRGRVENALRESEARFRLIADAVEDVFWLAEPGQGDVLYYSPGFQRWVGPCSSPLETRERHLSAIHPDDRERVLEVYRDSGREAWELEYRIMCRDGNTRWFRERAFAVQDELSPTMLAGVTSDVTEQKRNEENICEALRTKELLLREIHHRVKNNLQIISSLLDMAGRHIEDERSSAVMKDLQSKIHSMAMIHMHLYGYDNYDSIIISDYAQVLAQQLGQMYNARNVEPRFHMEDVIHLQLDLAIPCGLVLSEALSNAYKHAFGPEGGAVDLTIEYTPSGRVHIRVRDDGAGIPDDLDIDRTSSLGLRLMRNIVEYQLGGQLEVTADSGTVIDITFGDPVEGGEA